MSLSAINNYNANKICFSSLMRHSAFNENDKANALKTYCHDTYFFRHSGQLEIMHDYLKRNFTKGTHIANYGCSDGEETYSIAMIIEDINKDKKYTITGHDPSNEVIDIANEGVYAINSCFTPDSFLLNNKAKLSNDFIKYKKSFERHFKPTGKVDKDVEIYHDAQDDVYHFGDKVYFKVDKHDFRGIVNFVGGPTEGNIDKIDKTYASKQKPGIIVFRNAWYHILENKNKGNVPTQKEMETLKDVLRKVHSTLDDKGILVLGKLGRDHLLKEFKNCKGTIDRSPFHEALYECGFVPLKNSEEHPIIDHKLCSNIKVYTIWKKAPVKRITYQHYFPYIKNKAPLK